MCIKFVLSLFLAAFLAAVACAHTVIDGSRITLHTGDYVPRFATLHANSLVVPEGVTVELPESSEWDAIEVSGTLRVSRTHDTVCRFTNLQVLPTGTLDMGTATNPILRNVVFGIRDVPLDLANDPFQWGNGVFNLGLWTVHGRDMLRTWSECNPTNTGQKNITPRNPVDWQVGDYLLVPDTRQGSIRRESPVQIANIRGSKLCLTKTLDFEHHAAMSPATRLPADATASDYVLWRKNNGKILRYYPYVANATRNIIICSENPAGTRGHTVTTDVGVQQLAYASFIGLGRTLPISLNNTNITTAHVGTNQVGKYAIHWHHVHSAGSSAIGLYIDNSDIAKWGIVVHGTSYVTVAGCIVNRCVGAGIITEDGPEVGNTFRQNLVMGCIGESPQLGAKFSMLLNIPGGEGSGFWFHGTKNTVTGNVSCNNIIGINAFHFHALSYFYPSTPGGPDDTQYDPTTAVPLDFSGNTCFSNAVNGLEVWNLPADGTWLATQLDCWHNGLHQVELGDGERSGISFDHLRTLADGLVGTGIQSAVGYAFTIKLVNSRIEGSTSGILPVAQRYEVSNTTLHSGLCINWDVPGYYDFAPTSGVSVNCQAIPWNAGDPVINSNFPLPPDTQLNGTGYPE